MGTLDDHWSKLLKSDPIQPGISAADQLESQIDHTTREAVDNLESRWRALL